MMREIIKDFLTDRIKTRITLPEINGLFDSKTLEEYITQWKHKMYMKLLELYSKIPIIIFFIQLIY